MRPIVQSKCISQLINCISRVASPHYQSQFMGGTYDLRKWKTVQDEGNRIKTNGARLEHTLGSFQKAVVHLWTTKRKRENNESAKKEDKSKKYHLLNGVLNVNYYLQFDDVCSLLQMKVVFKSSTYRTLFRLCAYQTKLSDGIIAVAAWNWTLAEPRPNASLTDSLRPTQKYQPEF